MHGPMNVKLYINTNMHFKAQLERSLTKYLPEQNMFQVKAVGNGTTYKLIGDAVHRLHRGILYLQNVIQFHGTRASVT